jgi:hypothetical protein
MLANPELDKCYELRCSLERVQVSPDQDTPVLFEASSTIYRHVREKNAVQDMKKYCANLKQGWRSFSTMNLVAYYCMTQGSKLVQEGSQDISSRRALEGSVKVDLGMGIYRSAEAIWVGSLEYDGLLDSVLQKHMGKLSTTSNYPAIDDIEFYLPLKREAKRLADVLAYDHNGNELVRQQMQSWQKKYEQKAPIIAGCRDEYALMGGEITANVYTQLFRLGAKILQS